MNDPVYDELIRLTLKRELTSEDTMRIEAGLAAHPEWRDRFDGEAVLGRALRALPDVPVSSNFTAIVMEAIELDARAAGRGIAGRRWWIAWLRPSVGWGCAGVAAVVIGAYQYHAVRITRMAQDIRSVSHEMAALPKSLPGPEIFKDFDTIDHMRQVSVTSDDDLLKVLQQ